MLFIEFNKKYLDKFLKEGDLSREDLFTFYNDDEVNKQFKLIEKKIKNIDETI